MAVIPSLNTQSCNRRPLCKNLKKCAALKKTGYLDLEVIIVIMYRIVASTSPSCIEAHADLFRSLIKGIFNPYVLRPFDKKLIFWLVTHVSTRDFTVCVFSTQFVPLILNLAPKIEVVNFRNAEFWKILRPRSKWK